MIAAVVLAVAGLTLWTVVNIRATIAIGRTEAELAHRAEQFDLEDADLIERRRLLDAAERKLAEDTAQFAKLLKQANGQMDLALHNIQRKAEAKLEVPGQ